MPNRPPPRSRLRFPGRILHHCLRACRRLGVVPSRQLLLIEAASQTLALYVRRRGGPPGPLASRYERAGEYRVSTSRFGLQQAAGSNGTPAGLHRVAEKHGAGLPIGTSFRGRKPCGLLWHGDPEAPVPHRIFWLDGLEPGLNRGGAVDSFSRYIYFHGAADEGTLGRPVSAGCIRLAARDLLPLHDRIPCETLVWIE